MLGKFLSWDVLSKVAGLLCVLAALVPFVFGSTGDTSDSEWWQWLFLPLAIAFCMPFVGAPQIAMLILIRLTKLPLLRATYILASLLMIGITYWFITTGNFSSNSTAPLAIIFFPLQVGAIAFAVGGALLWIANRVVERRSRN